MTPAQKAGLVIGQKYEITGNEDGHCFKVGEIVTFVVDDGSTIPEFSNGEQENYVRIDYVKAVKQTPAQSAGLVIGQQYVLKRRTTSHGVGHVFTFTKDDETISVRFDCPVEYDRDGWCYLYVADVESYVAPVIVDAVAAESNVGITITIVGGKTEITVARGLTSEEVKAVMDIIKGQA